MRVDVTTANPVGGYSTLIAYRWNDRNGDHFASKDEVLLNEGILYYGNVDPAHPTATTSPNSNAARHAHRIRGRRLAASGSGVSLDSLGFEHGNPCESRLTPGFPS